MSMRRVLRQSGVFIWEIVKIVVISLAIILPVRYFLVQPFFVRGSSMEPNFRDGEYLIINEISYRFEEPQRGDVVVFRWPRDPSQYYIKRIIGLPGERIDIREREIIIYNEDFPQGLILDESFYLSKKTNGNFSVILDSDEYFVLGDNRNASSDSRKWGALPRRFIVGRVWVRAWPFDRMDVFQAPTY